MKNINRFWELNKNAKLQKPMNQVRTHEEMKDLAINAIAELEITPDNKFYDYVLSFAQGEVITNSFGKKLYFKRQKDLAK